MGRTEQFIREEFEIDQAWFSVRVFNLDGFQRWAVHPGPLIRAVRSASSAADCLNKARGPALHRQLSGQYQEYQDYQEYREYREYQEYQDYQEYQECQEYQRYPEYQECQGIFPGTLSRAVLERQQLRIA